MTETERSPRILSRQTGARMGVVLPAGLIFLVIFVVAYETIPANFYQSRDDGIITMSHARNLADYGAIGVNPAGERVEGFSAPLQMVMYYLAYTLFGMSYSTFGLLQTLVSTVLLGVVFGLFFRSSPWWGLGLTVGAAGCLALSSGFLEWHGSGMENPYTHLLVLLVLWVSWQAMVRDRISMMTVLFLFLATLVRTEFIGHVLPVFMLLALYFVREKRNRPALARLAVVPILWGVLQLARVWYFGDFFPNSAYAQSISMAGRLKAMIHSPAEFFQSVGPALMDVIHFHNGYFFIFLLPALCLLKWDRRRRYFVMLTFALALTTILSLAIFGPARLDETRMTTQLALLAVFLWTWLVFHLNNSRWRTITAGFLLLLGFGVRAASYQPPYYLCCSGPDFEHIRNEFLLLQKQNDLGRATIANPDLGVMSFHKDFNVVDLGCLGSPVLSRIQFQRHLVAIYFFEFVTPDIIECHPTWMAAYPEIFEDPRFNRMYERIEDRGDPWFEAQGLAQDIRFWVRRDVRPEADTPERRLLDDLQAELSLDRLQYELVACAAVDSAPGNSLYVTRAAYRFLPEFRVRGQAQQLLTLFAGTTSARYDQAVLDAAQRRDWYLDVIASVREFHDRHSVPEQRACW